MIITQTSSSNLVPAAPREYLLGKAPETAVLGQATQSPMRDRHLGRTIQVPFPKLEHCLAHKHHCAEILPLERDESRLV
jgi:hypothetical protein